MTHIFLSLFINMGLDASQSYYFFEQKKKGGKQKQAEFEAARDQPAGYVPESDTSITPVERPAKVKESVDCAV